MYEDEYEGEYKNQNRKNKKWNDSKPKVSKIDRIKKYYADMNESPEKVSVYVKKKVIEELSMVDRSRGELEKKVFKNIKKDLHGELVSKIFDMFVDNGYINDERFTENYIRIRHGNGYGRSRISKELKEKGIGSLMIEDKIEDYDFNASLIEYKERKYASLEEATMKEMSKIVRRLVSRGFDYTSVKDVFSSVVILKEIEKNKGIKMVDVTKFLEKAVRKGYGKNKMRQDASAKGIKLTDEDLVDIDFYEIAREYKIKKYGEDVEKDPKLKNKQIQHMLGRGFSYEEIKESQL